MFLLLNSRFIRLIVAKMEAAKVTLKEIEIDHAFTEVAKNEGPIFWL